MKPLRISNRITLQMADQALVETKAEIHPVEVFLAVGNWIESNPSHPRCGDAEDWLSAYESQNPNARPPQARPLSKETKEKIRWIEATVQYYRKTFGWPEGKSKKIILAMLPDLAPLLKDPEEDE